MKRIYNYFVELALDGPGEVVIARGETSVEGKWSPYQAHQIARAEILDSLYRTPEFSENGDFYGRDPVVTLRLIEEIE